MDSMIYQRHRGVSGTVNNILLFLHPSKTDAMPLPVLNVLAPQRTFLHEGGP